MIKSSNQDDLTIIVVVEQHRSKDQNDVMQHAEKNIPEGLEYQPTINILRHYDPKRPIATFPNYIKWTITYHLKTLQDYKDLYRELQAIYWGGT